MSSFWKHKKIIVYIALPHHTRFLLPVVNCMEEQGATVHYVVGQAERSQEMTAVTLGLDYSHVFDYVTTREDHNDVQMEYDRLAATFGQSLKNSFLFGVSLVTVVDKTLYATAMEYVGFRNLVRRENPHICFALHELNRWGKMLAFWAKKHNVPLVTFQEGMYYGLDFGLTGHVQYSTLDLVWGDRLKKKLAGFEAPADKILPTGNTHLANELAVQKNSRIRQKKRREFSYKEKEQVFLLLISGSLPVPEKLFPLLEGICESSQAHLIIKFHPISHKIQVEQWVACIPENLKTRVRTIHSEESVYNLLSLCDVCLLVQPSTTGVEALAFGKPLIHLTGTLYDEDSDFFIRGKAAVSMTPEELEKFILQDGDVSSLVDSSKVEKFLQEELAHPAKAVDLAMEVSEKLVRANTSPDLQEISCPHEADKPWSLILVLSGSSKGLLEQLEILAKHSEDQGEYEVILVEPQNMSQEGKTILDSLQGDVVRIPVDDDLGLAGSMNLAVEKAMGEFLVFLQPHLVPFPNWLSCLSEGFDRHGRSRIFGARILDDRGSLLHAGMVVDVNNSPVSAYPHLDPEFACAMKERSFQMLDHVLCMERDFFCRLGGFVSQAGKFAFMDLCLRANQETGQDTCIYLPKVCLMFQTPRIDMFDKDASIYFYGKWHGSLWESQDALYLEDHITRDDVDTARMARAAASSFPGR